MDSSGDAGHSDARNPFPIAISVQITREQEGQIWK